MEKAGYKKCASKWIGIGGWHCPCCGPAPGKRAALKRAIKRAEHRRIMKEAIQELDAQ